MVGVLLPAVWPFVLLAFWGDQTDRTSTKTLAPKKLQPRVEGVSLPGAMARQGGKPTYGQRRSTSHRRILYDAKASEIVYPAPEE